MLLTFKRRHRLCGIGLVLGTLLFAASLTPSLVPRAPWVQGLLGGFSLAAGYGIGVAARRLWGALQLPVLGERAHDRAVAWTLVGCIALATIALGWASGWQDRLRGLMGLPPADGSAPLTIAGLAIASFVLLLMLARLFDWTWRRLAAGFGRLLARPSAAAIAIIATAVLFWNVGSGVLSYGVLRSLDQLYRGIDAIVDDDIAAPVLRTGTGSPTSLIDWGQLGREGRRMVAAEPDAARIAAMTGAPAIEPLRVYVGLNSAETPAARARLALAELERIGAFDRANLVIATPTGTGWIDPASQSALEYVLRGDVATVSVQYSYLRSWLALLADPEYGAETARVVFATIYGHWRGLPRERRPRLYLHGLSLGALNGDLSHDLYQVISDPYDGILWTGPPFNTPTWRSVTAGRNAGSPAWLPTFGDGSVVRFVGAGPGTGDGARAGPAGWGPYRVVFLQYPSDAVTFFDPQSLWRRPAWMTPPLGPDVSPDIVWLPVVTFLQLAFDLVVATQPPVGHGHEYAFDDYVDAWALLTGPNGWTAESLAALKARVRAATGGDVGGPAEGDVGGAASNPARP